MIQFFKGFLFAFNGWRILFKSELNAKVHLLATILVLSIAFYTGLKEWEWAVIILCIVAVLAAEGMNTAIEILANRITTQEDLSIKKAKDVAAGAVLFVSFGAAAVGIIIFLPKISSLI